MILAAVGMLREARIVERPFIDGFGIRAVAGGGRSDLLAHRLASAAEGAVGVISIGVAGALAPSLVVGDGLIASEVVADGIRWPTDEAWSDRLAVALPHALRGVAFASDAMILHAADKARLHAKTGAAIADMESHVAARFAAERGLPFAVVRVVSDAAATNLPRAVTAGLKPDGDMNLWGVLAALARDPRQLPALMRTGRDADAAFKALSALAPRLVA
jgi:hopanoid-associated phosphorylase